MQEIFTNIFKTVCTVLKQKKQSRVSKWRKIHVETALSTSHWQELVLVALCGFHQRQQLKLHSPNDKQTQFVPPFHTEYWLAICQKEKTTCWSHRWLGLWLQPMCTNQLLGKTGCNAYGWHWWKQSFLWIYKGSLLVKSWGWSFLREKMLIYESADCFY